MLDHQQSLAGTFQICGHLAPWRRRQMGSSMCRFGLFPGTHHHPALFPTKTYNAQSLGGIMVLRTTGAARRSRGQSRLSGLAILPREDVRPECCTVAYSNALAQFTPLTAQPLQSSITFCNPSCVWPCYQLSCSLHSSMLVTVESLILTSLTHDRTHARSRYRSAFPVHIYDDTRILPGGMQVTATSTRFPYLIPGDWISPRGDREIARHIHHSQGIKTEYCQLRTTQ